MTSILTIPSEIIQSIINNENQSLFAYIEKLNENFNKLCFSDDTEKRNEVYYIKNFVQATIIKECVAINHVKPLKVLNHHYFYDDNQEKEQVEYALMKEIMIQKQYAMIPFCIMSKLITHSDMTLQMLKNADLDLFNYIKYDDLLEFDYNTLNSLRHYSYLAKNIEFTKIVYPLLKPNDFTNSIDTCLRVGFIEGLDFIDSIAPDELNKRLKFFDDTLKANNFFAPFDNLETFTAQTATDFGHTILYLKNKNKNFELYLGIALKKLIYQIKDNDFTTPEKAVHEMLNVVFKNTSIASSLISSFKDKNEAIVAILEAYNIKIEQQNLDKLVLSSTTKTAKIKL